MLNPVGADRLPQGGQPVLGDISELVLLMDGGGKAVELGRCLSTSGAGNPVG
ncbi:hypothetical protein [Mycobacterium sp.]|uniref:hypothetical protein n=1 Tax=Mycobacterium sp. TaxID=1785 RepID=UPI002D81B605|nr:hypothetical protein [Mycobacterium sp.]